MTSPARDHSLDMFKGLLVAGMVSIHVHQLLARSMPGWMDAVSDGINLVTFSGFLFALGIGVGMSKARERNWAERLKPVALLLVAAWISSLAFLLLVERVPLSLGLVADLLLLRRLFGWSEFLASFAMLYLALALFRPLLLRMASDPLCLALTLALAFAATWVVVNGHWPALATLVGTTDFAAFPLLPYLPWFVLGIRIGQWGGRIELWFWSAAMVCSAAFLWQVMAQGALPARFPPSALWVAGPALALLAYWKLAKALAPLPLMAWLALPGRHVLSFLLVSNLAIFALRYFLGQTVTDIGAWLGLSAALLFSIGFFWWVWERLGAPVSRSPERFRRQWWG